MIIATGEKKDHADGSCPSENGGQVFCICVRPNLLKLAWECAWTYSFSGELPPPPRGGRSPAYFIAMKSSTETQLLSATGALVEEHTKIFPMEYWQLSPTTKSTKRDCHGSQDAYVPFLKCHKKSTETMSLNLVVPYEAGTDTPWTPPEGPAHFESGIGIVSKTRYNPNTGAVVGTTPTRLAPYNEANGVQWVPVPRQTQTAQKEFEEDHCNLSRAVLARILDQLKLLQVGDFTSLIGALRSQKPAPSGRRHFGGRLLGRSEVLSSVRPVGESGALASVTDDAGSNRRTTAVELGALAEILTEFAARERDELSEGPPRDAPPTTDAESGGRERLPVEHDRATIDH